MAVLTNHTMELGYIDLAPMIILEYAEACLPIILPLRHFTPLVQIPSSAATPAESSLPGR